MTPGRDLSRDASGMVKWIVDGMMSVRPEQGQRGVVAERTERCEGLEGVELVVSTGRPMRQPIQAVGDPLGTALLGAPSQRSPADAVLGRLLGREEAVLRSCGGEEIFPGHAPMLRNP